MWSTIKAGETWKGKIKNLNKDKEEYWVYATIFPIFDDSGKEIIEYMAVRYLATDEEQARIFTREKIIENNKISNKEKQSLKDEIVLLEEQNKKLRL